MAAITEETYLRTAAHQEADRIQTRDNFMDHKYHDWPNEAGVSALLTYSTRSS